MAEEVLLVLSTWPDAESARAAAESLVNERLAACANLLPAVESIYRWEGAVEKSAEILMLIKTTIGCYPELERRIQELHSYEVPEVLAFRAADGLPAYLRWVEESCER